MAVKVSSRPEAVHNLSYMVLQCRANHYAGVKQVAMETKARTMKPTTLDKDISAEGTPETPESVFARLCIMGTLTFRDFESRPATVVVFDLRCLHLSVSVEFPLLVFGISMQDNTAVHYESKVQKHKLQNRYKDTCLSLADSRI